MIAEWFRRIFQPDRADAPCPDCGPSTQELIRETNKSIENMLGTRERLHQEIVRHERSDVARALLTARDHVTQQ